MVGGVDRQRSCGPCSACCKVMGVDEIAKPIGAACAYLKRGGGCSIHGSHPASCQTFACEWLLDPSMPHRLRPDQSKVVLTVIDDGGRLVANCDPANPLAWRRRPIYDLLKQRARATWGAESVLAKAGRRWWLIGPDDQDVDLGELDTAFSLRVQQARPGGPITVTPIVRGEDGAAH